MANEHYLNLIRQGGDAWNNWRGAHSESRPDLTKADLVGAKLRAVNLREVDLSKANLKGADLRGANLSGAVLREADLSGADLNKAKLMASDLFKANLSKADLSAANLYNAELIEAILPGACVIEAILHGAKLCGADLRGANLAQANLIEADLSGASLNKANLSGALVVDTILEGADLTGATVYGISVWDVKGTPKEQFNLVITPHDEPTITVDDLKVAQFVYLLVKNENIRDVINTVGKKGVLILGRFNEPERKSVLDAIRIKLRLLGYVPIVFDFERPTDRDFKETVMTLAGMCLFLIADITKPKSVTLELEAIVPDYQVPLVPIIQEGEEPFSMFRNLRRPWVLDLLVYDSAPGLVRVLEKAVITPALKKNAQLVVEKAAELRKRHTKDYQ